MAKKTKKKEEAIQGIATMQLAPIGLKPIGEITEDAYIKFGGYVNNHRQIPRVIDGLKVSYRRLIHSSLQFTPGKHSPTCDVINRMSQTHPHSLTGVEGTVRMFVRSGVFHGDGNFGRVYPDGSEATPANPRYTKVMLSDTYRDILGDLVKEVPWEESPVGAQEPTYIPLPIPFALMATEKIQGLGVGVASGMPNFSPQSLYNAYLKNDPSLLEPNIDLDLIGSRSELHKLWTQGTGKVTYSYHIKRVRSEDSKTEGVLFYGDTGMFTIDVKKKFKKLLDDRKVCIDNVSDMSGPKLLVTKIPGARGISIEEIEDLCSKSCYNTSTYTLNVSDGLSTFKIPLYNWLDYVYKNYINLLVQYNTKKIQATLMEIEVQKAIPYVVDYILNKNPKADNAEITAQTGIPVEIVRGVMEKPISNLRKNKDTASKVKELEARLKELNKFDPVKFTESIIQKL